jgi:septum formation inhibitor MinC
MSYEDDTLIRLRRQYSKDETVAALSKKLSEAESRNAELKSKINKFHDLFKKSYRELKLVNKENKKAKRKMEKSQKGKIKHLEENFELKKIENKNLIQKINELNAEVITLK